MIKGSKMSEESRKRLSESHKGKKPWNKDKETPKEVRKKQSESHKGKIHSEESKMKISAFQKNKIFTDGPCVNPQHAFLGTQKDNMQDMIKKNRRKY